MILGQRWSDGYSTKEVEVSGQDTAATGPLSTLCEAARRRDIGAARELLAGGADPNGRGGEIRTPLHEAALNDDREMVDLLAAAGTDPSLLDGEGLAPLHQAALYGQAAAAEALLSAGADPNTPDRMTWMPLHHAVAQRQLAVARILLNCGADPDAVDDQGMSPRAALTLEPDAGIGRLLDGFPAVAIAAGSDDAGLRRPDTPYGPFSAEGPPQMEAQTVAARNFLESVVAKLISDGVSPAVLSSAGGKDLIRAEMMEALKRNL